MRGDLGQSSLAHVMRHLYAERKNGLLHLSREGVKRRIHFKKGVPIFADAADGELPTQDQATGLLYSLFSWTEGLFVFEEVEPNVDEAHALSLSPPVAILEGSRRIAERHVLEHLTGGTQSVFACTQTSELPLFTMKLSSAESAILEFAREHERFTTQDLPFESEGVVIVNALNALLSVGLLEIVGKGKVAAPEPAPAPPAVAPTPEYAPPPAPPAMPATRVASQRREVENLLDTFEAKRAGIPTPSSKVQWAPPPLPVVEPAAEPDGPHHASELGKPPLASPPHPEPMAEQREAVVEPLPPEPPPLVSTSSEPPPEPASRRTAHLVGELVSRWILRAKVRAIVVSSVALLVLGALAFVWLTSRRDEPPPRSTKMADDSTESRVEQPAPVPQPKTPKAEPGPEIEPEPSDAELFYSANLAFENGEYERSKQELSMLLERRPEFHAARELMARVDRELAPRKSAPQRARPPQRVVAPKAPEPKPRPDPEPAPEAPLPPDPDALFDDARRAYARDDLEEAEVKLGELETLDAGYAGARKLREQIDEGLWERKLPIVLTVRHDHALGGCDGVLTLTKTGYAYRSKDHEWIWGFNEITETERRDSNRLRIETKARSSFNFELREKLPDEDWARYQALGNR